MSNKLLVFLMGLFLTICMCACKKGEEVDTLEQETLNEFLELVQTINENSDMGFELWEIVDSTKVKRELAEDYEMEYPDDEYMEDGSACGTYCVDPEDDKLYRICQIMILEDTRNVLGTKIGDDIDSVESRMREYDFVVDEESKTHRFVCYWHKTQNIRITYKFPGGKVTYINIGGSPVESNSGIDY